MSKVTLITFIIVILISTIMIINVVAQESQEVTVPFIAELPVVVTNPGQAPEYSVLAMLSKRINLPIEINLHLEAKDLEGFETLILIIGGSGKGLGSAGVNLDAEVKRAKDLIKVAKEKGIKIIGMHLGGESRRGPNSDIMIDLITPECDYVIIRADGNKDEIFTNICEDRKIPLVEIEKSLELTDYLKALFEIQDN